MDLFQRGMDRMTPPAAPAMTDAGWRSEQGLEPNARLRDGKTEIVRRPSSREINSVPGQLAADWSMWIGFK